jgi:hypothetical protein
MKVVRLTKPLLLALTLCTISTVAIVFAQEGYDFVIGDLRVDLSEVYSARDYKVHLWADDKPSSGMEGDFTGAWLGVFLAEYIPGVPGSGQFSQVGLKTDKDGIRWFVYAEPGVECLRGDDPDPYHCYGNYGDLVALESWHQVELLKYPQDDFWIARVYNSGGTAHDVARILSNSNRIYKARSDTEQGYFESSDPYLTASFYHWHPQYMKWGTGWQEWPESSGDNCNSIWTEAINGPDPCPDHYGADPYWTGDPRAWFAGTGGKWCDVDPLFPATYTYLPDIKANYNGWNSTIIVRNNGSGDAHVQVAFYDSSGNVVAYPNNTNLHGQAIWTLTASAVVNNFSGSAVVYVSEDVSVVVYRTQQSPFQAAAYPGVYSGATEVHLPLLVRNWYGGQNAEIVIQNTSASFASITVSYYWRREINDGGFIGSETHYSVPPNGLWVIRLDDGTHGYLNEGNGRYLGSAVITADQPVAAVVNDYFDTNAFESYRGFYDSGTSVHTPLITKNWYGRDSGLQIQNVGASTTHVTVRYYNDQGNEQARDEVDLPAKASVNFYRPESLPYRFLGSAVVESSGETVVAVSGFSCATEGDHQLHEGFVSTGSATSMALVERDSTWRAGIQVQNMGWSGTWTYLDFYYQDGYSAGSSGSKYVGLRGSVNFYDEVPSNFLGSAVARDGEPLGPMVNLERSGVSGDNMMGYSAVR